LCSNVFKHSPLEIFQILPVRSRPQLVQQPIDLILLRMQRLKLYYCVGEYEDMHTYIKKGKFPKKNGKQEN